MRASAAALACAAALLAAMAVKAAPWIDVSKPLDADNAGAGPSGVPPGNPDARAIAEEAAAGDHVARPAIDADRPSPTAAPPAQSASPRAAAQRQADLARPLAQATLVEAASAPVTARKSPQMMAVPGSRATLADAIDDSEEFSVDNGGGAPAGRAGTATDMPATAPAPATGSTSRAPVAYVLPGPRYQVQPGDILQITVWKEEDLQREVLVRPDGGISFPLAGDVQAAGRTVDQVQEELAAKIESYIPEPVVTVAVKQVVGNRVYVVGRVNKPGEIIMGHELTVMQALSLAGGVTPFAALNRVHVLRRENGVERSIPFRYGDVEKGRSLSQNIVLRNGDVVVVP